ncbi:MAG: NADH-quinone oxidoreductase subunit N [Bacteroidota bacterium]
MDTLWRQSLDTGLAGIGSQATLLLPEWFLVGGILLLLLLSLFNIQRSVDLWTACILGLVGVATLTFWPANPQHIFSGQYTVDSLGAWAKILCLCGALGYIAFVRLKGRKAYHQRAELYILLLGFQLGLHLLIGAQHFVLMLVALEMISLSSYLWVAFPRGNKHTSKASLTYVLFGLFSSAVTIYGLSWLYGLTGTLSLSDPSFLSGLQEADPIIAWVAFALFLTAFLFKLTAFPMHFWVADVYKGISYPLAMLLSVTPKIGGCFVFLRILHQLEFWDYLYGLQYFLLGLAIISITWGNLGALVQGEMKKLMAYSGISHAGYLLLALAWVSPIGEAALIFYLTLYLFMNYATFTGLSFFVSDRDRIVDMAGQGMHHPVLGIILGVNLVALAGLPPTAGFIAKWYVVTAAIEQLTADNQWWLLSLLALTVINTAISLFYYLKPIVWLFFRPSVSRYVLRDRPVWGAFIIFLTLPVMFFGVSQFDRLLNLFSNFLWN